MTPQLSPSPTTQPHHLALAGLACGALVAAIVLFTATWLLLGFRNYLLPAVVPAAGGRDGVGGAAWS